MENIMEERVHSTRKYEHLRQLSDEALVEMARWGEPLAPEILITRYEGMVRALAGKYFMQGADREDVVQEGRIGLLEAIGSYCGERDCAFRSFAHLCVKRQILTAVKTYSRRKNSPLNAALSLEGGDGEEEPAGEVEDAALPSLEEQLIRRERMAAVYRMVERTCSELEKKVLWMLLEGSTYQEIAAACHRSVKSVDGTLQRVRRKLAVQADRERV